jgi:transcriptional regulator with XRE-family HTH domain
LRREELAQLCDISPTWLTWIEQGRTESVSIETLKKISQALQLSKAEHEYLLNVAGSGDPNILSDKARPIPDYLQLTVDVINSPAYVLNKNWDVVAWNPHAEELFDVWLSGGTLSKNLLTYMFTNPSAKQLIVNWPDRAKRLVAEFRADCGKRIDQPELVGLVSNIQSASTPFKKLWASQDVLEREVGEREFNHHKLGKIRYKQVTLRFAQDANYKLVMLIN